MNRQTASSPGPFTRFAAGEHYRGFVAPSQPELKPPVRVPLAPLRPPLAFPPTRLHFRSSLPTALPKEAKFQTSFFRSRPSLSCHPLPQSTTTFMTKQRKVAVITAGNSGVGWHTAHELYVQGYVVYLAGRSKMRCMKLIHEIETVADSLGGELRFLELDLALLDLVLAAATALKSMESHLDVLVNNAGVMGLSPATTPDLFELQLQTNYVLQFLLTTKLLPLLERAADMDPDGDPPRVLYLSSVGHRLAFRYFNLGLTFDYHPDAIFTWFRYAMAKTAGIHFMKMLALRNPRILCVSVQPGFVMNTNYFSYWTRLPIIGILFWCFFQLFGYFFGVTVEQGADALVAGALDPQLTLEEHSGATLGKDGKKVSCSSVAGNMDYAARSWIWTIHQLGKRHIDL